MRHGFLAHYWFGIRQRKSNLRRGFGGVSNKAKVIRKIIREKKILFLGITETKSSDLNEHKIRNVWVDDVYKWAKVDPINLSGGLIV